MKFLSRLKAFIKGFKEGWDPFHCSSQPYYLVLDPVHGAVILFHNQLNDGFRSFSFLKGCLEVDGEPLGRRVVPEQGGWNGLHLCPVRSKGLYDVIPRCEFTAGWSYSGGTAGRDIGLNTHYPLIKVVDVEAVVSEDGTLFHKVCRNSLVGALRPQEDPHKSQEVWDPNGRLGLSSGCIYLSG